MPCAIAAIILSCLSVSVVCINAPLLSVACMSLDDIVLLFSPFYILIIHFTRCIYRDWYHYLFSVLCSATFHLLVVCAFVTFFNKYLVSCILTFMNLFSLVLCSFTYKTRQNARQFHSFTFSINATASNCILYGGELSKWQIVLE